MVLAGARDIPCTSIDSAIRAFVRHSFIGSNSSFVINSCGMLRWSFRSFARQGRLQWVRFFTTSGRLHDHHDALSRTRNIGIIAHIDAGKTTTTERMLYYSGYTRRIGDVDDGSTVTDFLPAERARGITIQSAAITFNWPPTPPEEAQKLVKSPPTGTKSRLSATPHSINLIDTPGHADFTFEVLRSLRVLDGAVCILDGVAGVEAQTEKVWHQANQYRIPRIVYVNKLDRDGAAFHRTVKEVGAKLNVWPAVCEIPWWRTEDGKFCGVGDVVGLRGLLWEEGTDGRAVKAFSLKELDEKYPKLAQELRRAREALVERLSEHDEEMVEKFLDCEEDHLAIPEQDVVSSLRRCTMQSPQQVAPVYAGASFRNIGVQPLLDAVVDLLPSPAERPDTEITIGSTTSTLQDLLSGKITGTRQTTMMAKPSKARSTAVVANLQSCALAFKVVNDAKRGVLVYVRVYSGSLTRGAQIFNTNLNVTERAPRLLRMYASDALEIPSIDAGQIGVIVGLKHARTGDTLISYMGMNAKTGPPAPLDSLQLRPIAVPPPVFFTSIEPDSLAEEKHIKDTLDILLREDPSLSVSVDAENGQTHLAGMGELHLEIARDRLINDFKAKARIGKIDINYREAVEAASKQAFESAVDREIGGKHAHATTLVSIAPIAAKDFKSPHADSAQEIELPDNNHLTILHPTLSADGRPVHDDKDPFPPQLTFSMAISALQSGVSAALARGPTHGYPVHSTHVTLHLHPDEHIFPDTSAVALSVAAREATQAALEASHKDAALALMEPVMLVTISVGESDLGAVVHDLSAARGGHILSLDDDNSVASDPGSAAIALEEDNMPSVDPNLVYAPPDPYTSEVGNGTVMSTSATRLRQITARVPLREMVGYLRQLRSLTAGRGTFVMQVDRFEKVSGQRLQAILKEVRG
ncbi:translation elongation factor G [Verruconis gallopava]|uniref:Ribosome-releasing factor 2, mitochondrial n=1 Tax=Verruconis gallopava TaxID=253628 RepID=A0A0D1XJD9_9PEZI|nr:translation elongation factor G [Verruconis gallopava]KIW02416.1 translation elongation factor G [Verruconis gallopava]